MAAVPSTGRASGVEGATAPEADLTRALYEQYANQIFRYCLHRLGSREEAEDAVQSTFLNAFRGLKRGIVPEAESAWLFKIAHNVCLSRRRSTWRRGKIESPADFEIVEELAPAPSRRAEELIGLQDVLEQMPEQQRRAILLREWQGLSYREIAAELELSQAAVETLIFRARRSLAQGLEQPVQLMERRQARRAAGAFANLLSWAQAWLVGGGAAVKVAATVAVVSAGTVVATAPVHERAPLPKQHSAPDRAVEHTQAPAQERRTSNVADAQPVSGGGVQRVITPKRAQHVRHVPAAAAAAPLVAARTPPVVPDPAPAAPAAASAGPDPAAAPAQPQRHGASRRPKDAKPVAARPAPAARRSGQAKKAAGAPAAPDATPPGQAKQSVGPPGQSRKSEISAAAPPVTTPPVTTPAPLGDDEKAKGK